MTERLDFPIGNKDDGQFVHLTGSVDPLRVQYTGDKYSPSELARQGRVFYASDADQNDAVTGQTSFANTTPTFMVDVPKGLTLVPLMMSLSQTGTVAGALINVVMEFDDTLRYASGGTSETTFNARPGKGASPVLCRSGATAAAGYGIRVAGWQVGADVDTAEGAIHELLWTPTGSLDFLDGPASWLIYTYAGTTGPTWLWTIKYAVIPTIELA